jgi:DNA topoisomerase-1
LTDRVLVIAEKPSAARRLAQALDENSSPRSENWKGVITYFCKRNDKEIVVVSAIGHLYSISQDGGRFTYPVYKIKWVPTHTVDRSRKRGKQYLDVIKRFKSSSIFVSACDYDLEGSLIAYNIIRYFFGEKSLECSKRMRFSALTDEDLQKAWDNLEPLDTSVISAGKSRHETDWLFGINLSRALGFSVKAASGSYKTLSIGRVQGPMLKFVYEREVEIRCHVPIPYWSINAETIIEGQTYQLEYEKKKLEREIHVKKLSSECRGKSGQVTSVEITERYEHPHSPFNLSDLQREAYKYLKINPSNSLKLAESLYLKALISYPRTNSQKIPQTIDIKNILKRLTTNPDFTQHATNLLVQEKVSPKQGKKDDPAHPAIHPTGKKPPKLVEREKRLYDLITWRFLSSLSDPAISNQTTATIDVNGHIFYLIGRKFVDKGWMQYYPYDTRKEKDIPTIEEGDLVSISRLSIRRKYSKLPVRFNSSRLIGVMERDRIGTKATRTSVIDTLFRRGYIRGESIQITELGFTVVETLNDFCPEILSVELTREMEENIEKVQSGGLGEKEIFESTIKTLNPILSTIKENEVEIGMKLLILSASGIKSNECRICHRDIMDQSVFCEYHQMAYSNIEKGYENWRYALDINWVDYITRMSKMKGVGIWVKEVIGNILKQSQGSDV